MSGALVSACNHDDARPAQPETRTVTFEYAEESVVMPSPSVDTRFIAASHLAMHGLPLATACKRWRWGLCHGLQHSVELGADVLGTCEQEFVRRDSSYRVVEHVSLEEVNPPDLS